jgi:hypothetical protein
MADTPGALQLRLLQTVVDVSAEKNSTLVMPFPVEMLRFFEHQSRDSDGESDGRLVRQSDRGAALSTGAVIPEPAIPAPALAPSVSLPGERAGGRAQVARERRDNWPTRRDAEEALSG